MKQIKMFGGAGTHDRYQAMLSLLCKALEHHKLTGDQIGYTVLGARHPKSLTKLLPASSGKLAESDSREMLEQIRTVLRDEEITAKYGVYDVVYNHDEDIQPRLDFYIVPVPVGRQHKDLTSFITIGEQ